MARPPSCAPSNCVIAFWASSSFAIETNAKPRGRPVMRSRITVTLSTAPACENISSSSGSLI